MSRVNPAIARPTGHLFVVDGDVKKIACDAMLVPTDAGLWVTPIWQRFLGLERSTAKVQLDKRHRPQGWGDDVRVTKYRDEKDRPQIWLGNIGKDTKDVHWHASGAVAFVEEAGRALLDKWVSTVPPRLAVNVVGSGQGGRGHDKGVLFDTLVPALHDAAVRVGVDVVLVPHGAREYSAAQRSRHKFVTQRGTTEELWVFASERDHHETAASLARHVRVDSLVLFIGAGVSMGAGIPTWQALLDTLAVDRGYSEDEIARLHKIDVRDQAALIAKRYPSSGEYQHVLTTMIDKTHYSLAHGLLASLRIREAITTNYDRLYEKAVETDGRELAVLPNKPVIDQGQWLLKLHGSLDQPDDIVLTRDDYLGLPERAGALFGILQAMLMTRHMLFVGYSLNDDTFHKVMHQVRRARQGRKDSAGKLGTVLTLFDDPFFRELWGDELDVVALASRPAEGESFDYARAARDLDLLLDLVSFLAADVTAFILDPTYRAMLTDDEVRIAAALRALLEIIDGSQEPMADQFRHILRRLR